MKTLLSVKNLVKHFPIQGGFFNRTVGKVHALNGVSLEIQEGKTLGLVGESGCGKSTLGRSIMRLIDADAGEIYFDGKDLLPLSEREIRPLRKNFQMVFQDPYSSLNPRMRVENILEEALIVQKLGGKEERKRKVLEIIDKVGLSEDALRKYPHEFSGGQRQRIGIARALILAPKLIVADEPVSALDVSIQAQIVNLMLDLQKEFNLTYLFIAHDIKLVQHMSDEIAVMYLGKIVEQVAAHALFECAHPYTQALLSAIPDLTIGSQQARIKLEGDVPSPINFPSGCVFHERCPFASDRCRNEEPELKEYREGQKVACFFPQAS